MDYLPEPIIIEPRPFTEHYVKPAIHYVGQFMIGTVAEVTKIVAAQIFLKYLLQKVLSESKTPMKEMMISVVAIPVIEEILFRGCIQRGIGLVQKGWNYFVIQRELSPRELDVQRTWRVQMSAIIFAAAHLTNPHRNMGHKLTQFTWAYMGGVAYGYLSDKYQSLSVSILVHGFNNMLVAYAASYQSSEVLSWLIINKVAAYTLGTTDMIENAAVRMREFGYSCLRMSAHASSHLTVPQARRLEMA